MMLGVELHRKTAVCCSSILKLSSVSPLNLLTFGNCRILQVATNTSLSVLQHLAAMLQGKKCHLPRLRIVPA